MFLLKVSNLVVNPAVQKGFKSCSYNPAIQEMFLLKFSNLAVNPAI